MHKKKKDTGSLLTAIFWLGACLLGVSLLGCDKQTGEISHDREALKRGRLSPARLTWSHHSTGLESMKLAHRKPAEQGLRFEMLGAQRTGIDWVHRWDPPPGRFEKTLDNAFAGGGICLGDYDGDGLPDLFLTRPHGGNRLYHNVGDFRFEDVTEAVGLGNTEYWGTGCSFGDIDNDGDLDLYVCAYHAPNRLYINQGNGTFVEQAKAWGLDFEGASVMIALSDYDLDGDLDAYLLTNRHVATDEEEKLIKNFNLVEVDGQWTAQEEVRDLLSFVTIPNDLLNVPKRSNRFNLQYDESFTFPDGRLGVLIMTGQKDRLYRNNLVESGESSFTNVTESTLDDVSTAHHIGLSATWWDFNRDGLPDLYVANDFKGPDQLYQNNGDGTFRNVIKNSIPHTPWYSMGADTADINNDGLPDFMGSDMLGATHYNKKLMMGNMGQSAWFLEAAQPPQQMRNAVYLNSGTGQFMETAQLMHVEDTGWTWAIKFGDLDNDGDQDLYISNGMTREWFNSDLREQSLAVKNQGGEQAWDAFWRDQSEQRESNLAFENRGDLQFKSAGKAWGLDYLGVSFGAALGDLDQDGDLDLVVNNFEEPVSLYRNNGSDGQVVKLHLHGQASNRFGIGATVRIQTSAGQQVRYLTMSRGFMSANDPIVHFGLGQHETIDRLTVEWPSGHVQGFDNIPANRFYKITEPNGAPPPRTLPALAPTMFRTAKAMPRIRHNEKPFNDFQRQPLLPQKLSQLGPGLACGDIDGDDNDDLFVGGAAGQAGCVILNHGDGRFESLSAHDHAFFQDRKCEDMAPLLFDVDSDGDLDLYVVSGSVECEPNDEQLRDRLYFNNGSGIFTDALTDHSSTESQVEADTANALDSDLEIPEGPLPDVLDSGSVVTAADFDRDGDLDLFIGGRSIPGKYPLSPNSRLLRNDWSINEKFTDVTDEIAPGLRETGLVTSAIWSDADGDGDLDLLVTHEWGPVKLWENDQGHLLDRTANAGLADRLGWFNGIAGRDLDNDGDIDYVVTSFGLNTKYHATPDKPVLVYFGDFEGTGKQCLVEAEFEDNTLFPVRGRSCSSNAMPFIREKFPSFKDFASASLQDIYSPSNLEDSHRFEINSLASGVLINDGGAKFRFNPLPRLAQVSPGFGVVLTEIDGDGLADLYLVQNFFTPQLETGRMDGGLSLLLKGLGDGTFTPVWPNRSGLIVSGDAKGLMTTDLNGDGWVDFVVSANDGELMAFENNGVQDHRVLNVRLRGKPGNPTGVGARVSVRLEDGTSQTAEVYAGGGYLSQSSSTLVFGLGKSGRVKSIEVRWPNGAVTSHPAEESTLMIINQEG